LALVLACQGRPQPLGCYYIQITITDSELMVDDEASEAQSETGFLIEMSQPLTLIGILLLVMAVLVGFIIYLKNQNSAAENDSNVIQLGEYRFNRRTMQLILGDERIELTSKECDLLQLLYQSVNDTVERDTILRMVWNDEGDYVGRTLDVFISKLRKKLEADSSIKIANIRGVGYKLIVDT
jgi:DNA-binding winged helix-turn-helix (wHTH) protein